MVSIDGLTKSYGRLTAVADVSLSIRRGEVLGLIGPNGSGKTTLFECIAGLLPYEAGTIRFGLPAEALSAFARSATARPRRSSKSVGGPKAGEHILTPRERASRIFYLPDAIAPWPAQTVRWALDFIVGFFGPGSARRDEVVERLGLGPLLNSPIGTLSKGQRKRAVLGIGMLTPHPLLLTDEPFDGLDLRQTRDVGAALRAHAAAGRTLFLSIHQISDAARVCDRFVLLSGGRVRGEGTVEQLARGGESSLEEVFLALT
jgi:ABC-type multidrug transport system ATPase subunit